MEKKPYLDFKAGVSIVESQIGLPWRKIVGQALGGGVFCGGRKNSGRGDSGRATDETIHSKLIETLTNLARLDAKHKGQPDPVKTVDYRGVKVYAVDKDRVAVVADWLVVTNQEELGKTDRRSLS